MPVGVNGAVLDDDEAEAPPGWPETIPLFPIFSIQNQKQNFFCSFSGGALVLLVSQSVKMREG